VAASDPTTSKQGITAFFTHAACGRHDTGWGNPEHQGRLRAVMSALERALPGLHQKVISQTPDPVPPDVLTACHGKRLIQDVRSNCDQATDTGRIVRLNPDTAVSPASWEAALAAVACTRGAVQAVVTGPATNAFCAVRPPGHHATPDEAMGFCLFNNVALAARHALSMPGIDRVLIADWDVHHGNGTQDIFYHDGSVFFFSMHQHPHYPGTGMASEIGAGDGEGLTLNIPLPPHLPASRYVSEFLGGMDEAISRLAPDIILLSAGFDAAIGDPLGGFTLETDDFAYLTREVAARAGKACRGRLVSVLEGGYNPPELGRNVAAHVTVLAEAA